ncbi:hypothetical protein I5M27_13215 [Adhaeribacter sp. BT258]|uniref:Outer membrane protein beta-barrel domain-containing protein n=1 Tax=Adhaeribacter terrigena TaxID=2793070 RepID=A0ABS1C3H3_9BACT|nr:hypothetical protein [Adhaeribacter terrigena]MBK0403948.1 hypothetical protein [Adhaeribacter terrigena]
MHFKQILRRSFFAALLFSLSTLAFGQSAGTIGLGVKAGDPTGLSVKFYRPALDIEVVVGRPYYFSGRYHNNGYYRDYFYKNKKYKYYRYHYYEVGNPVAFQVHFLKSKSTKAAKELKWYLGAGPQLRTHKVNYYYYDDHNVYINDRYTNIDLGLDGVFGLEYTFSDLPISIFTDINLFMELVDDVNLELQGGIGVRYNLK